MVSGQTYGSFRLEMGLGLVVLSVVFFPDLFRSSLARSSVNCPDRPSKPSGVTIHYQYT